MASSSGIGAREYWVVDCGDAGRSGTNLEVKAAPGGRLWLVPYKVIGSLLGSGPQTVIITFGSGTRNYVVPPIGLSQYGGFALEPGHPGVKLHHGPENTGIFFTSGSALSLLIFGYTEAMP